MLSITKQEQWRVRLEGKVLGEIRPVHGGYQYFPKGAAKQAGEVFKTLAEIVVPALDAAIKKATS